jgi:hypothetical protein
MYAPGVTSTSAVLVAQGWNGQTVRVTNPANGLVALEQIVTGATAKVAITGLAAETRFDYVLSPSGTRGHFRTFPSEQSNRDVLIAFGHVLLFPFYS